MHSALSCSLCDGVRSLPLYVFHQSSVICTRLHDGCIYMCPPLRLCQSLSCTLLSQFPIFLPFICRPFPFIPHGYERRLTPVVINAPQADGSTKSLEATVLLVWTQSPDAVGEVLAEREAHRQQLAEDARAADAPIAVTPHLGARLTTGTAGCLSFGPMAQCIVHALKGLACRARVTPASSPASHCKQYSALTSPSLHRAAAPVLLAHAEVTENIIFFQWVQNLGTRRYVSA